jgi:hypothetical protein
MCWPFRSSCLPGLTILGTHDLVQTRHSVLRSYPISAHLRFLLETMRPEMLPRS